MKKFTLLIAAICFAFAAQAQETYKVMKIHKGDEVTHTIKLSDIDSFTFEQHGPIIIEEISVGDWSESGSSFISKAPRGAVDDDAEFHFSDRDKVLMTATVDGKSTSNSFTYNAAGDKWEQDAPVGNYKSICVQDNPTIESIVSYGGKAEGGVYTDQSSMERYAMASELIADQTKGKIELDGNVVTARLAHDNSDLALKVYDGDTEENALAEETPVLKVTIDKDGSNMGSVTKTYTAWNMGKHTDEKGTYTLFRVQLRARCTILKAELSKIKGEDDVVTREILFTLNSNNMPSNEVDLERGKRYTAEYTYYKDVALDETTKTYTVFTAEGLQQVNQTIANNIQTKAAYNITLAADITLPDPVAPETSNWIPLGYEDEYYKIYSYKGTFDGAGHTISNLQINSTASYYVGLIGVMGEGGAVQNLTLNNPVIASTGACVGGLVGSFNYYEINNTTITNCHIKGGSIKGEQTVGGIAGDCVGDIVACTVNGTTIDGYTIVAE